MNVTAPVRATLLFIGVFLVLFPLSAGRPGMPPVLKADEPAYFMMAESLALDGDLLCELSDVERTFARYPYLPIQNLILMSADGWNTVHFGKPYIYSLLAAPATALFGSQGMVAFNMALLMLMIWMGTVYLSEHNPSWLAALFSTAFFLLSSAFSYVFWLHPEVLNMFAGAGCLFFALHDPVPVTDGVLWRRLWSRVFHGHARIVWSAALLALGIYNKPVIGALALPVLWLLWRRRGLKAVAGWVAALALSLAALAGISVLLTGQPSAYLGAARGGVKIEDPRDYEETITEIRKFAESREPRVNSWTWIFRIPEIDFRELGQNLRYFLLGRHTGLVPYMPFAVVSLLLFLLNTPRDRTRWWLLLALATVALFFLLFIPFNWHGGGGFIGNRYFVMAYPGFLFLVTAVRPRWLSLAGATAAALLLGALIFTPYGAPVPSPTLQAHVRGPLFRHFPLEIGLRQKVPGYEYMTFAKVHFMGRRDVYKPHDRRVGSMWVQGAVRAELVLITEKPIESLMFQVYSRAPDNEVVLELQGSREVVVFENADTPKKKRQTVEIRPSGHDRRLWENGKPSYVYDLAVHPRTGVVPRSPAGVVIDPMFYLGAELTYLGTRAQLESANQYRISWLAAEPPPRASVGEPFTVPVRVRNDGRGEWRARGPLAVHFSYRWRDGDGQLTEGLRTRLDKDVASGAEVELEVHVRPPNEPGVYTLMLDAVRENIAWFSRRGAETFDADVVIVAASDAEEPAPADAAR